MSDSLSPEVEDETVDIDDYETRISTTLYTEETEEIGIRQVSLGVEPLIILEMSQQDGEIVLEYVGSLINSHAELLEMLEAFTDNLRLAVEQGIEEPSDEEGDDA